MRFLKWSGGIVLGMVLLAVAGYVVLRALGPSQGEREALALLDAGPEPRAGVDGFAALYTARHDIPAAARDAVVAEDVRRLVASPPPGEDGVPAWTSALEEWPSLQPARGQGDPPWCSARGSDCLDRVRAAPDAYAGLLQRHAGVLDRAAGLRDADRFANPFPPRLDAPFPAFQSLVRLATRTAWQFQAGQVDLALAHACQDVALGRRMIEAGDNLIGSMIGAALLQDNASLLGQMLAELPRDYPLPAQCARAVTPALALEQGLCRTMQAEGRFTVAGLRDLDPVVASEASSRDVPEWALRLLFDPEATAARVAPVFTAYCQEPARRQLAADLPLPPPPLAPKSPRCLVNAIGCVLSDIAAPPYVDYALRLQDADAQLRTLATLLELRGQDGAMDAAALERLPAARSDRARPLLLDAGAGTLGVALYARRKDADAPRTWSLLLPASRLQVAPTLP